jgi:hypothetical protein
MNLYIVCGIIVVVILALTISTTMDGFEDYMFPLPTALIGTMCPVFVLDRKRGLILGASCYDQNSRLVYNPTFNYGTCSAYAVKADKSGILNCYTPSKKMN